MRKCSEMPFHIGVKIKLHLSHEGRRLLAVNSGAQRSVYNRLVAMGNEKYRLKKTAAYSPADAQRLAYIEAVSSSPKEIKNALPYLYSRDVDC